MRPVVTAPIRGPIHQHHGNLSGSAYHGARQDIRYVQSHLKRAMQLPMRQSERSNDFLSCLRFVIDVRQATDVLPAKTPLHVIATL